MNNKKALELGFTNHGSYYGIPINMTIDDSPMVATKSILLEPLFSMATIIEQLMYKYIFVDSDPSFMFKDHGEIKP